MLPLKRTFASAGSAATPPLSAVPMSSHPARSPESTSVGTHTAPTPRAGPHTLYGKALSAVTETIEAVGCPVAFDQLAPLLIVTKAPAVVAVAARLSFAGSIQIAGEP